MKRNLLTLVSSLTILLCATFSLFAQDKNPPENMTFQGFLTRDNGVPFGNTTPVNRNITFKIYGAPQGGTHLWGESQVVTIDKGHFSVLLGLGSADGPKPPLYEVFTGVDSSSRWIELKVGSKVISPRIQFFAAPYAQLARVANELASGTGDITSNGTIKTTGDIDARGVKASGVITGDSLDVGAITGDSLALGSGGIVAGKISGKKLIGTSLSLGNGGISGGNINGKAITGTSLSLGNGDIDAGNIAGARLNVGPGLIQGGLILSDGDIRAAKNLQANGRILAAGPNATLQFESRNDLFDTTWEFTASDLKNGALKFSLAELKCSNNTGQNLNVLKVNGFLQAISYQNISDKRFKKVYGISKGAEDLSVLKNIKIQNYEWIENKMLEKKVIAQQVKEVFPQAVNTLGIPSLIPNISSKATSVHHDKARSELQIVVDKPHALAVGDSIDMYAGKALLKEKKVIQITDKNTFVVSSAESYDDIFVVGKYVNDVLTVDYDAIAMLNVSATQELARQAEELESRVRDLEARERRVALLEENLEAKMSRLEAFEKRLDALDKRLVSVSPQIDRNTEGLQVSVSAGSSR